MDNFTETIATINTMAEHGAIKNVLTSMTVHNMRRFQPETTINFEFPITVLVGKNGSGKTTIMKLIQALAHFNNPQEILFETVIDNGGMENASFTYRFGDEVVKCSRVSSNKWRTEGEVPKSIKIVHLNPKMLIGAFEKSFLYDDIGKNTKLDQKVEYVIKQSRKVLQNKQKDSARKKEWELSTDTVRLVNDVLQLQLTGIRIVKHKYFSGTWATNVIFSDGIEYSEYNAGSGEFLVAMMLDSIVRSTENALLLLDEPEISLHPGAQKRFMQCLFGLIKKKKFQVIMTTHSASIVEGLPSSAIICLRRNNLITAEGNLNYRYAFTEIEETITKKQVIVEDIMAQRLLLEVIKEESLTDYVQVDFFPGGADNIKTQTILTYAKTQVKNRFIIFDGDQRPTEEIPDFSEVLDKDKTPEYYKGVFRNIVEIKPDTIPWGVDANRKEGRKNEEQEVQLLIEYLEFYKT